MGFYSITQQQADAFSPTLFGDFLVIANPDDPWAGIELLAFELAENQSNNFFFTGFADVGTDDYYLEVSVADEPELLIVGQLSLGEISVIPEPGMLGLMCFGLMLACRCGKT